MKKNPKAFTLVELLLGLTIFSIILASLYSTFSNGIELNRRSEDVNRVYREARWSLEILSRDLENARAYDYSNSYPQKTAFSGEADKLSFIRPTEAGLKIVNYYLEAPKEGSIYETIIGRHSSRNVSVVSRYEENAVVHLFIREEKDFVDDLQSVTAASEKQVLSSSAKENSLKFSYAYLEGEEGNEKVAWKDSWTEKYVPASIRIKITFINPDKSTEPLSVLKEIYIPTGFWGTERL